MISPTQPAQIRVDRVSFAPQLFKSVKLGRRAQPNLPAYYSLRDVSFEVFQGDLIAIVGAAGAGKTSLLRLLNRLISPTQGSLYFNDRSYTQISSVSLRQHILLLPQETKLLGMTVQEALTYPLQLRGVLLPEIAEQVTKWRDRLQIPSEWLARTEQQLSLGQRQWVAIARALIAQPQVLLLDEPTTSLDISQRSQFLSVLKQSGCAPTVLMVTHQLDLAQAWCTRVLHFQQGQLVADQSANAINWHNLEETLQQAAIAQEEEWA
ncbi:ATP-binding cassette domain-containing protein [Phormidium sp. CLA17]|nr:ATP-binding cassette domain-containing protein [Leptolyngbya sp. Cla-17]